MWRTKYPRGNRREKGVKIDASYETADGSFRDIVGFQKLVTSRPDRLARNLAEHLVAYGTGASCTFADRDAISEIVRAASREDYGTRSLIRAVVLSDLFRTK